MNIYLWEKFKNQYRVLPELDLETKDIPRDYNGNIEPSFDDFYIPCKGGIKIKHATQNNLTCYVPKKQKFNRLLLEIYEYEYKTLHNYAEHDRILSELKEREIISEGEYLDTEGYFVFKTKKLPEWEHILKPKTQGSGIHPYSIRNIPVSNIQLDAELLQQYREIVHIDQYTPATAEWTIFMQKVRMVNKQFALDHDLNLKQLQRQHQIRDAKVIFQLEGLWNEYIAFLQTKF